LLKKLPTLHQIEAELYKRNFYEFAKAAWNIIQPGRPLSDAWYIKVICDTLQLVTEGRIRKLIINVPPRTGKSTFISVLWPCWTWARDPSKQFMCASYRERLSFRDSAFRRNLIEEAWYQERWGCMVQLVDREKQYFTNTAKGSMFATSTSATATGFGGDVMILDDPHDPKGAESELQRESTTDFLNHTWPSRRNGPDVPEVLIMQRLHEADATGMFIEQGGWTHLKIPMVYEGDDNEIPELRYFDPRTQDGQTIDEVRFPDDWIQETRRRYGPYGWAGQYQQNPVPPEGAIFKKAWFNRCVVDTEPERDICYAVDDEGQRNGSFVFELQDYMRFGVVDVATSEKETVKDDPDWSTMGVFVCLPTASGPILILLDFARERLEGPDVLPKFKAMSDKWACSFVAWECVGERTLFQMAQRRGIPVREVSTSKEALLTLDRDKVARAMAATPLMADGRFYVPLNAPWLGRWIAEHILFPKAAHDDQVDVTSAAVAIVENGLVGAMKKGVKKPKFKKDWRDEADDKPPDQSTTLRPRRKSLDWRDELRTM
jgi:predicted phage terminase large subunit-like protein